MGYVSLERMNLNVRKMDLRIAAIVLECGGVVVTRNVRDFDPGRPSWRHAR
jgi:predicted nucleic acid-binding protein